MPTRRSAPPGTRSSAERVAGDAAAPRPRHPTPAYGTSGCHPPRTARIWLPNMFHGDGRRSRVTVSPWSSDSSTPLAPPITSRVGVTALSRSGVPAELRRYLYPAADVEIWARFADEHELLRVIDLPSKVVRGPDGWRSVGPETTRVEASTAARPPSPVRMLSHRPFDVTRCPGVPVSWAPPITTPDNGSPARQNEISVACRLPFIENRVTRAGPRVRSAVDATVVHFDQHAVGRKRHVARIGVRRAASRRAAAGRAQLV